MIFLQIAKEPHALWFENYFLMKKLSVAIKTAHTAFFVAFASIRRFEFCFLPGRNEMLMFFVILNDFFRHHLALEAPQSILDILVVVKFYVSQFLSHSFLLGLQISLQEQTVIKHLFPIERKHRLQKKTLQIQIESARQKHKFYLLERNLLLAFQPADLNEIVAFDVVFLHNHLVVELSHLLHFFGGGFRSFHFRFVGTFQVTCV